MTDVKNKIGFFVCGSICWKAHYILNALVIVTPGGDFNGRHIQKHIIPTLTLIKRRNMNIQIFQIELSLNIGKFFIQMNMI